MTEAQLRKLLGEMSLQEKAEQLVQLNGDFFGGNKHLTGPAAAFRLTETQPYRTGTVLSEHGAENLKQLQDEMMKEQPHHIPAVFMADIIHGYKTVFPVPIAIGASFDPQLCEEIASACAAESAAAGIHVTFSPMADLSRDSRWGRCMESFGEDPHLNSKMTAATVKGFQGENCGDKGKIAACFKHFAAYGAVLSGRDYNVTELSMRTFMDDYITAYQAAVEAGAELAMTAFNTVDRVPCTVSGKLIKGILREKMGFEGVVITDYNAIGETINHGVSENTREAAKKAMLAGCDIDMMSDCYINNLADLVQSGEVPENLLDEAVMRVLKLKNKLGLFENPYKDGSIDAEKEILWCDKHKELSRRAAGECAVLLKNNGVLPLKGKNFTVIGALAESREITGFWAMFTDKDRTITLKEALTELYPDVNFSFFPSDTVTAEALESAGKADAVILAFGEDQDRTGESRSCTDISLSKEQKASFEKISSSCKNIVTLLFGGRPLAVPEIAEKSDALLNVWLPGSFGTYGIADILFGKVNPSGRLSMSYPYTSGQMPLSYSAFNTGRPKPDTEGFVPFVSNYMDCPNVPLYPFGYGLSYSKFEYSPVSLDSSVLSEGGRITASVKVKNTSDTDGRETIQLYIRDITGSVVRPLRELKGFKKLLIKAGETAEVSFEITPDMLKFYDINMDYTAEKGKFTLWAGPDSSTANGADFELV